MLKRVRVVGVGRVGWLVGWGVVEEGVVFNQVLDLIYSEDYSHPSDASPETGKPAAF
jgi:hypothetical protein